MSTSMALGLWYHDYPTPTTIGWIWLARVWHLSVTGYKARPPWCSPLQITLPLPLVSPVLCTKALGLLPILRTHASRRDSFPYATYSRLLGQRMSDFTVTLPASAHTVPRSKSLQGIYTFTGLHIPTQGVFEPRISTRASSNSDRTANHRPSFPGSLISRCHQREWSFSSFFSRFPRNLSCTKMPTSALLSRNRTFDYDLGSTCTSSTPRPPRPL